MIEYILTSAISHISFNTKSRFANEFEKINIYFKGPKLGHFSKRPQEERRIPRWIKLQNWLV